MDERERQTAIQVWRKEKARLVLHHLQSRGLGGLLDLRGSMREHVSSPMRAVDGEQGTWGPPVRIENENAPARHDACGFVEERFDLRKVKDQTQRDECIETGIGKRKGKGISLNERRKTVLARFPQHRGRGVQADGLTAGHQDSRQPPGSTPKVESAPKGREKREHLFDLARVHPRAAGAAETALSVAARDLRPGVKLPLVVRPLAGRLAHIL